MKITYKIVPVADGTFELFKQANGKSVRTMGNYETEREAERVKKGLEAGAVIRIEMEEKDEECQDHKSD